MSNRIPVDNFGSPLQSKDNGGLSKHIADRAYLNVRGGDQMAGDLDMGGYHISNVESPESDDDVVNKQYVDLLVEGLKLNIHSQKRSNTNNLMVTAKFNLTRLPPMRREPLPSGDDYFIVSIRYKRRDGDWDEGQTPNVKVSVKDKFLHIRKESGLWSTSTHLTGECEVLLMRGGMKLFI